MMSTSTLRPNEPREVNRDREARLVEPFPGNDARRSFPLTDAQREIWLACQMGIGASCAYNESFTLALRGPLALDRFCQALQVAVDRHEALRLTFAEDGSVQFDTPRASIDIPVQDWSTLDAAARQAKIAGIPKEENLQPFDLTRGPLVRARICRLASEHHLLVFTAHYLVCDGWSAGVVLDDVGRIYAASAAGLPLELAPSPCFSPYAAAGSAEPWGPAFERTDEYWLSRFRDIPPPLELPTDFPRSAGIANHCEMHRTVIDASLANELKRLSSAYGCTMYATMLAAFQVLLQRLSGQEESVIGILTAGQASANEPALVGHCVNMLPIRGRTDRARTFPELAQEVNRELAGAREHGRYTYGRLLQKLKLPRTAGRAPLLSVIFNLARRADEGVVFPGLRTELEQNPHGFVNFDLFLSLRETAGGFAVDLEYNAGLFEPATVRRWLGHFETLLRGIAAAPETPLARLPLLNAAERRELLLDWNATHLEFPREASLHELVSAQASRTPDAVAIVDQEERITYDELDRAANRIAHHLRHRGMGGGSLAGICLTRTWRMIAAILGVLKTGAAYVPMDPAYPARRLAGMAADAQLHTLITESGLIDLFNHPAERAEHDVGPARFLFLDQTWESLARESTAALPRYAGANDVAYVIYTSGSTGRPKGVAIEHHSAVSFVQWACTVFRPVELEGVLAGTSVCFDLSIFEIFVTLIAGGKIILAENALQLPELPAAAEVRLVNTVPSVMAELLRAGELPASVLTVNLAGEPLSPQLVHQLYAQPQIQRVFDLYGPTECTTYSTCALREPAGPATIGRPIANTQIYILDAQLQPVPVGVIGELCIGGEGVARGYLRRPELTAEKFVDVSFQPGRVERIYRTGDCARYRTDGSIEYLGRRDQQVKIRGFRIELGEIESALQQHPAVRECRVIARAEASGDACLVAYVVPHSGDPNPSALRTHLQLRLPDYMVPSAFGVLEKLPLTPNGKLDRAALPAPTAAPACADHVAPRTEMEEIVAEIWCDVLERPRISVADNFFELGGHSLLAMRALSRVNQQFGLELSFRQFFSAPTVERFAPLVEAALIDDICTADPTNRTTAAPRVHALGLAALMHSLNELGAVNWLLCA